MCSNCKPTGPQYWVCGACGETNNVESSVTCRRCGHSLFGRPIRQVNPVPQRYQGGMPPRR